MEFGDDNSVVAVVVAPALGGFVGLALFGPLGFFVGAVSLLVAGAAIDGTNENDERIAELEQRVEELETERSRESTD